MTDNRTTALTTTFAGRRCVALSASSHAEVTPDDIRAAERALGIPVGQAEVRRVLSGTVFVIEPEPPAVTIGGMTLRPGESLTILPDGPGMPDLNALQPVLDQPGARIHEEALRVMDGRNPRVVLPAELEERLRQLDVVLTEPTTFKPGGSLMLPTKAELEERVKEAGWEG